KTAGEEATVAKIIELVSAVRNLRAECNVSPAQPLKAFVRMNDPEFSKMAGPYILRLARLSELNCGPDLSRPRQAVAGALSWGDLYLSLEGVVDFKAEEARLTKKSAQLARELGELDKKLTNHAFILKAAPDAVTRAETQQQQLKEQYDKITTHLQQIRTMAREA
ncbi:MAG TPA: hypothetical protein VI702_00690, partial [Nitrospiria bacterium]